MDIQRAKEILSLLADGIDPTTGEVLPDTDSCNRAEVVRAFHAILTELEKPTKKETKAQPENAGKPWSADEDEQLRIEYRGGTEVAEIAKLHKRSKGSIASRLVRIGEITEQSEAE